MPYNQLTPTAQSSYNSATNQLGTAGGTFAYDGAGNMSTLGQYALSYDYENRLVSAQQTINGATATASYVYDGVGQRVQKVLPSGTTNFVYDAFGQLSAEYASAPPASACTTCYLSWDHLGSTRMVTDASGTVIARHDFLPFGDEIPANSMGRASADLWNFTDNISQKFTGQERDETGLDYFDARFFASSIGRFISPDPMSIGADVYNPQSWNGYAYVTNSPLSDVDPDGMQTASTGSTGPTGGSAGSAGSNPWWSWNPFSIGITLDASLGVAGNFGGPLGSRLPGQVQPQISAPELPEGDQISDRLFFGPLKAGLLAGLNWVDDATGNSNNALKTKIRFALLPSTKQQVKGVQAIDYVFNVDAAVSAPMIFRNYPAFRRALGAAGDGMVWHHVVEQSKGSQFGAEAINSLENVVKVPWQINHDLNRYYSSKQAFTNQQTVRQWLNGQSWEEQTAFGIKMLGRAFKGTLFDNE